MVEKISLESLAVMISEEIGGSKSKIMQNLKEHSSESLDRYCFVKSLSRNEIMPSDTPSLKVDCPKCNKPYPVVMKKHSTGDSSADECYTQHAAIYCCGGEYILKTLSFDDHLDH